MSPFTIALFVFRRFHIHSVLKMPCMNTVFVCTKCFLLFECFFFCCCCRFFFSLCHLPLFGISFRMIESRFSIYTAYVLNEPCRRIPYVYQIMAYGYTHFVHMDGENDSIKCNSACSWAVLIFEKNSFLEFMTWFLFLTAITWKIRKILHKKPQFSSKKNLIFFYLNYRRKNIEVNFACKFRNW